MVKPSPGDGSLADGTAIIVLNWNQLALTRRCIASIRSDDPSLHLIVIDNGSRPDERADRESIPHARCTFLATGANRGFAGGVNLGLRTALARGFRQVLLLNNDAILRDGTISALRTAMIPGVAAVCPMVIDEATGRVWSIGGTINWRRGTTGSNFHGVSPTTVSPEARDCDFGSGACLLLSADALEHIGLLDETYFAYWEETDWCARAANAGFRVVACPTAVAVHRGSASTSPERRLLLMVRNCLLFMRRHATFEQMLTFLPIFFLWTIPVWSARTAFRNPSGALRAVGLGLLWHARHSRLPPPAIGPYGGDRRFK